jgi:lipopolysaccharide export system protein LptA
MFPQKHRRNKRHLFFIVCFLMFPLSSFCLPSDKNKPMSIAADQSKVDYKNGITTDIGDVSIDQGTSHASGNKLIVYRDNQGHSIKEITLWGNLAHYNTLLDVNKPTLYTQAKIIKYFPERQFIILEGSATATRGANSVSGHRLTYDMVTGKLSADAEEKNVFAQQTHMVIYNNPKEKYL